MLATQPNALVSDELLSESAAQVQQALIDYRGIEYQIDDLKTVLKNWLLTSVEDLCENAADLCVSGDRNAASFNRELFEKELNEQPALHIIRL